MEDPNTTLYRVCEHNGVPVLVSEQVGSFTPGWYTDWFDTPDKAVDDYRKRKLEWAEQADELVEKTRTRAAEARRLAGVDVRREESK